MRKEHSLEDSLKMPWNTEEIKGKPEDKKLMEEEAGLLGSKLGHSEIVMALFDHRDWQSDITNACMRI